MKAERWEVRCGPVFLAQRYSFAEAVHCWIDYWNRWPFADLVIKRIV